jgi:hypothetical protein
VVVPVSTGLLVSVLLLNSFGSLVVDRSVGMPPLTSIDCCWLLPVLTGLSVLLLLSESRGLPCSHSIHSCTSSQASCHSCRRSADLVQVRIFSGNNRLLYLVVVSGALYGTPAVLRIFVGSSF